MTKSITRISLREFIASDYLSKGNLRFPGEIEAIDVVVVPSSSHQSSQSSQSQQRQRQASSDSDGERLLRAAKLALLLAKTVAKLQQRQRRPPPPSAPRLDDFVVAVRIQRLEVPSASASASRCASAITNNDSPDETSEGVDRSNEKKGTSAESDDDDLGFDLLISEVLDVRDDGDGPSSDDGGANVNGASSPPNNAATYPEDGATTNRGTAARPSNAAGSDDAAWRMEVVDVEFRSSARRRDSQNRNPSSPWWDNPFLGGHPTPVQNLGDHVHFLFSKVCNRANDAKGVPPLIMTSTGEPPTSMGESLTSPEESHCSQRSPRQMSPFNENSLFSTLLETGCYPDSICRLLSDMIESGNDVERADGTIGLGDDEDKANEPSISLEEVIQDMEQMTTHPQIFLHNQGYDFYSSQLHFGQRCYGREEELTQFLEISTRLEQQGTCPGSGDDVAEVVFVSGVAGSGKSHFVQNVGRFLTNLGWMVYKAKFKREMEHGSREIVSSLFEEVVADIAEMGGSDDEADVDYHRRVTEAVSRELEPSNLSCLANFIPSITRLFPAVDANASAELDMSPWLLEFLLSKLLRAIASLGRRVLVCLDDLQWCDRATIALIRELVASVGQDERGRRRLVLVGMYRDDETPESRAFRKNQLAAFQKLPDVRVTEIGLPCLSAEEVSDMIAAETRLPRRLVSGLARVVHKKTSGHAMFVIQVLNSLVRDSTIAYSPRRRRFDWDENKIAALKMEDNVAGFVVSSLSSLGAEALRSLRILSCFGFQTPLSMVQFVAESPCTPEGGIEPYLPGLIDGNVVEMSGTTVLFSHDLIQQHVYENIPERERRRLHLDIGTFIASRIQLDCFLATTSVEDKVEDLKLDDASCSVASRPRPPYKLVAIATNQINVAGPGPATQRSDQIRFAMWNLQAGKDAADNSNFQAALYFYKSGIAFLGDGLWLRDCHKQCHELHENSAIANFAIGDHALAARQAAVVVDIVPLEDSLVTQHLLVRALDNLGQNAKAVAHGLDLLRSLKFDIVAEPTPQAVARAMEETERAASAYTFEQITNTTRHVVGARKRNVMKCANALVMSFFRAASLCLPLVGCAVVNYSLQNGICQESASAFMIFGYFKVTLEGKFKEGCYWGNVVMKLLEGETTKESLQTDMICTNYLNCLYYPFRQIAFRQMDTHHRCMALGEFETGLFALSFSLMFSYYGGERLTLILSSMEELIDLMLKHIKEASKITLQNKKLIEVLVGSLSGDFPDYGGSIWNERTLLADALIRKNFLLVEAIYAKSFNCAFWMGDYPEAIESSRSMLALPTAAAFKIQLVFHDFFMGLISFQMYRNGEGNEHLDEGEKMLNKMKVWSKCSTVNFDSKLLLLEAEHHASEGEIQKAKVAYEASGRSARDHGLIQEQGLACEYYGKFLSSIVEISEASRWLKCAHQCYVQWGAMAKAEQLRKEHDLGVLQPGGEFGQFVNKHGRDW